MTASEHKHKRDVSVSMHADRTWLTKAFLCLREREAMRSKKRAQSRMMRTMARDVADSVGIVEWSARLSRASVLFVT